MIHNNDNSSRAIEAKRHSLQEAVIRRHSRVLDDFQTGKLDPARGGMAHLMRIFRQAEGRLAAFNEAHPTE
ncbi:hypothetical protein BSL82_13275 [Tardibacter chloracetimidivorans]|uniref:Uncharacterized protein n=1 Tax=Tardibacter chloracetimidivorans TaxID=1921510 RepID=A0A1L3ZWZ8_9SPHN|nr:hypothetical protein [Tardibacter chloracetimidivorans]API60151.1 hypothetical protein BSL82_13275 [Tardibacter chloracetimidivorans]